MLGSDNNKSKHSVLRGVLIQELDKGKKDLQKLPEKVKDLLESRGLVTDYNEMVAAVLEKQIIHVLAGLLSLRVCGRIKSLCKS